jgi:hypothetical protein
MMWVPGKLISPNGWLAGKTRNETLLKFLPKSVAETGSPRTDPKRTRAIKTVVDIWSPDAWGMM